MYGDKQEGMANRTVGELGMASKEVPDTETQRIVDQIVRARQRVSEMAHLIDDMADRMYGGVLQEATPDSGGVVGGGKYAEIMEQLSWLNDMISRLEKATSRFSDLA